MQAFSSWGEWGLLFFALRRLIIAMASLVVEHRLWAHALPYSQHAGSVVVVCGLSCSTAPALTGGFLPTAPPRKSQIVIFN